MKLRVLILTLFIFLTVSPTLADGGLSQTIAGYEVSLTPTSAQVGAQSLTVSVHNPQGQPLDEANITLTLAPAPEADSHETEAAAASHNDSHATNEHDAPAADSHNDSHATNEHDAHSAADSHNDSHATNEHDAPAAMEHDMDNMAKPAVTEHDMESMEKPTEGHSHGGAPTTPTEFTFIKDTETGTYKGPVTFPYEGKWQVNVIFNTPTETQTATFTIEVARNQTRLWVVMSFIGFNTIVMGIAAMLKQQRGANHGKR